MGSGTYWFESIRRIGETAVTLVWMGVQIEGYEKLEPIGHGGFSEVYKAWQPKFGRHVAIKVLRLQESSNLDRDAFQRECQAIGAVASHPNIVSVFDNGMTSGGRPYIVMELYEKKTFLDELRDDGCIPYTRVLKIGAGIADALQQAHDKKILHRDIKPQNILFSNFGVSALADFGIAYQTSDGTRQQPQGLTVHYASPEVLDEGEPSVASDIYSLGATLYTALAGRRPFHDDDKKSTDEIIERILAADLPSITKQPVPADFEQLIRQMMSKDPTKRPRSAREVGKRLRALQDELDLSVSPMTTSVETESTETTDSTVAKLPTFDKPAITSQPPPEQPRPYRPVRAERKVRTMPAPPPPVAPIVPAVQPAAAVEATNQADLLANNELTAGATIVRSPAKKPEIVPPVDIVEPKPPGRFADIDFKRLLIGLGSMLAVVGLAGVGIFAALGNGDITEDPNKYVAPDVTITEVIVSLPAPPANVKFVRQNGVSTLSWDKAENAAKYGVLFEDSSEKNFDTEKLSVVIDPELVPEGEDHCVRVRSISDTGKTRGRGKLTCLKEKAVTAVSVTLPVEVTNVTDGPVGVTNSTEGAEITELPPELEPNSSVNPGGLPG